MIDYATNDGGWVTANGQTTGRFAIIRLDGGNTYLIDRIRIQPMARSLTQRVKDFAVDVSTTTTDNAAFTTVLTATAANNGNLQEFILPTPVFAKYIRYRPLTNQGSSAGIGTDVLKVMTGQEGDASVAFRDLSRDPDSDLISWTWDFGDGTTSTDQNPTRTFPGPGSYPVVLRVTDAFGHADSFSLTQRIFRPPTAAFTFSPASPNEGDQVVFTATASDPDGGSLVQRTWHWGDGTSFVVLLSSNTRSRTFDNGTYTVAWEVIDSQEQVTAVQKTLSVANLPPVVDVGRDRIRADAQLLDFAAAIDDPGGDSFTCSWDFGDGSPRSTACHFRHAYDILPGAPPTTFTATLTVTDKDGGMASDGLDVTVKQPELLVLSSTLKFGEDSPELEIAEELGFAYEVATPAIWTTKTTADFASYKAIVLADPDTQGTSRVAAAEATRSVWGPAVTGNVILIGTDQTQHLRNGGDQLLRSALAFAADDPGQTGAFISLSEYYHDTAEGTAVPLLDAFSPSGFTTRGVGCYNDVHIVATHPALTGLTDAHLSNWSCSVHEAFDRWPDDFLVLAIARGIGAYYTAADGSSGTPYILARGDDLEPIRDIALAPETATVEVGSEHNLTATVDEGGNPTVGKTVTFSVTDGPHTGTTGMGVTGSDGTASFSYAGSTVGTDTVVATFVDRDGETQTSNEASIKWTQGTNRAPVADDLSTTTLENTPVAITLTATDPDAVEPGAALTFAVLTQPAHGTLSGTAPDLTYTPDTGYSGPDALTYIANDGLFDSNVATVSIIVDPANSPPFADAGGPYSVVEGSPLQLIGSGSLDPDGDALTFEWDPDFVDPEDVFDPTAGVFMPDPSLTGPTPSVTYCRTTGQNRASSGDRRRWRSEPRSSTRT